jgi:putative ABC transport system permease protein
MVAFMVPMLTVLGIKDGIIGTLTRRLLENPRNMELSPTGTQSFDEEFFQQLSLHPDAAFLIPETRFLSATIELIRKGYPAFDADLASTGEGDPLLKQTVESGPQGSRPIGLREVYLTEAVADKMGGLKAGDTVMGRISRQRNQKSEYAEVELTVLGVVPRYITPGYNVFCSLTMMRSTEDYRNGYSVPELGWDGLIRPDVPFKYTRFRLYAKDLDGVDRLRLHLLTLQVDTYTQAAQIELVKNLDRSFTVVFITLFVVVGGGAFASAASGSIDQVAKMRRSLSVLSLLGLSKFQLLFFTIFQAALTGFLASLLADGLFLGVAGVLNNYFGSSMGFGEQVCALAWWKLGAASALAVFFMISASGCAYSSLADIEPSEGMRDV